MAVCEHCGLDMTAADSCLPDKDAIAFGSEKRFSEVPAGRCHDCFVLPGGVHHPGCDMEECPDCGGQFVSCECVG